MLGLTNPDMLATQMASAGIGPEVMAPQLGLGAMVQPTAQQIPMPGAAQQMVQTAPGLQEAGPSRQVASLTQDDIFDRFMGTVSQKVRNPNALAAIAATGSRESGFSPTNSFRTWDDVGKPAGGIMSWRDNRLNAMLNGRDITQTTPESQAEFFLNEGQNMGYLARLEEAKTPQEAQQIMNQAWAFKGFDNPEHPETVARYQAADEFAKSLGAPAGAQMGTAGSTIDFGRGTGDFSPTPAISEGGTQTQEAATLPVPTGGGIPAGGMAGAGVGAQGSATTDVMQTNATPEQNTQTQSLGARLAALGKGLGKSEAFTPQKKEPLLQPSGSAPQVGGGFARNPQAIAELMQLLGGAGGAGAAGVPSLASMIQPRR